MRPLVITITLLMMCSRVMAEDGWILWGNPFPDLRPPLNRPMPESMTPYSALGACMDKAAWKARSYAESATRTSRSLGDNSYRFEFVRTNDRTTVIGTSRDPDTGAGKRFKLYWFCVPVGVTPER